MKNIVILFAGFEGGRQFDKVFDGKSAFERSLLWAEKVSDCEKVVILAGTENAYDVENSILNKTKTAVKSRNFWTVSDVLQTVAEETENAGAQSAVFAFSDCPFLSAKLTAELLETHEKYKAEYSFADGFPAGLAPEVIHKGCAAILRSLSEKQAEIGGKRFFRDGIFSVMKSDINSFEIETVLSEKDYRMLRFDFECTSKSGFLSCEELFKKSEDAGLKIDGSDFEVLPLCDLAESLPEIQCTVPHFYNIQISGKESFPPFYSPLKKIFSSSCSGMKIEDFKILVDKITCFSEEAVVGLSLFGEPFLHPEILDFFKCVLSHPKLSLFIETDGLSVDESVVQKMHDFAEEKGKLFSVDFVVQLDAFDAKLYSEIHGCGENCFETAKNAVILLEKYFPGRVYPQFTRMNENEAQLEKFFRFWNEKTSPSKGRLIIQKYDSLAGLLPEKKSADLSPLERNPCWHLRRDMCVLPNGDVCLCRARFGEICGNVFTEPLDSVWEKRLSEVENHINKKYCEKCRACDEFYTFNF